MARARNIKPSFFTNDELVELPMATRMLFIGLWTLADREGRLEDRPKRVKMNVFPADDVDVDESLSQLHEAGFIVRYQKDGGKYIQILKFTKHQNPHKNERPSTIPAPDEHGASTVQAPEQHGGNHADSHDSHDSLNPDTPPVSPRRGEARKRAQQIPDDFELTDTMRQYLLDRVPQANPESEFEQFCNHHRAKGSRMKDWQAAWRTWVGNAAKWQKSAPAGGSDEDWMRGAI